MGSQSHIRYYDRKRSAAFLRTAEKYGGLSNMAPKYPIEVNGTIFRTSEALYQTCRFPNAPEVQRIIISEASPMTAKMKSKPYRSETRTDWDVVRVPVMRWCLRAKLVQNFSAFSELLLSTGELPIVEMKSRGSDFWGARIEDNGTLVGSNILGRLLMELREEMKRDPHRYMTALQPLPIPNFLLLGEPINAVEPRLQSQASLI